MGKGPHPQISWNCSFSPALLWDNKLQAHSAPLSRAVWIDGVAPTAAAAAAIDNSDIGDGDAAADGDANVGDGDTDVDVDDGGADVADDNDSDSAYVYRVIKSFPGSQNKHQPRSECLHKASHLTDHAITRHMLQTGKPGKP